MPEPSQPQPGADILVQCLIRHGVEVVFAYPGGTTMPIHQALSRVSDRLRTVLPRHEQGGGFAAHAYARASGRVGVCMATSGPGATNLVTCLANAQRDAVPLLAITGQVNTSVLGTDAFQEIPIVTMCRVITRHHYQVRRGEDLGRVFREALHLAVSGRPGPVLVDVPRNVQVQPTICDLDPPVQLPVSRVDPLLGIAAPTGPGDETQWPAAEEVIARLWAMLRQRGRLAETILTSGVGRAQSSLRRAYRFPDPRLHIAGRGLGTVGFALPAAIGAQVAQPSHCVIAVEEPEGFVANVQELACAYCERLPVKVLLLNDWAEPYPDPLDLARGFRASARCVTQPAALDEALSEMLGSRGPYLLDVRLPHLHDGQERPRRAEWINPGEPAGALTP
jgi:acetolactate synthase-1/2/3 large subunit